MAGGGGQALVAILGSGSELEHKYRIAPPDLAGVPGRWQALEQWYLPAAEAEHRVRSITDADGHASYVETTKSTAVGLVRTEVERPLDATRYAALRDGAAPAAGVVKARWTGAWGGHRYEVDHLSAPGDLWLLEVEVLTADEVVTFPPFLTVLDEVTTDPRYRNGALARHGIPAS